MPISHGMDVGQPVTFHRSGRDREDSKTASVVKCMNRVYLDGLPRATTFLLSRFDRFEAAIFWHITPHGLFGDYINTINSCNFGLLSSLFIKLQQLKFQFSCEIKYL